MLLGVSTETEIHFGNENRLKWILVGQTNSSWGQQHEQNDINHHQQFLPRATEDRGGGGIRQVHCKDPGSETGG